MTDYPGWEGFLGTRASFMLDFVSTAMAVIIPILAWSIRLSSKARNYSLHKRVQLALAVVLLVAVAAFETEMRIFGWRERAAPSPYYSQAAWDAVDVSLCIHLFFSITAFVTWLVVVVAALTRFSAPPRPGAHSAWHMRWGKLAAISLLCTAVSGWVFYYLAFVATRPVT